jgi:hypothetical protein
VAAQVIHLADPLPCVAWAGWQYCGAPATLALAELRSLATGHHYELRPYCPAHEPAPEAQPRKLSPPARRR